MWLKQPTVIRLMSWTVAVVVPMSFCLLLNVAQTLGITLLLIIPPSVVFVIMLEDFSKAQMIDVIPDDRPELKLQEQYLEKFTIQLSRFAQNIHDRDNQRDLQKASVSVLHNIKRALKFNSRDFCIAEKDALTAIATLIQKVQEGLTRFFVRNKDAFSFESISIFRVRVQLSVSALAFEVIESSLSVDTFRSLSNVIEALENLSNAIHSINGHNILVPAC